MNVPRIQRRAIDSVSPDPDQPRKTFDEDRLRELAETYRVEGQIVPIEVDEDGVIVTGERRWRAAKLAGLGEVDVIVRTPRDRLRRQLIEEFHREKIEDIERARAMKRFMASFAERPSISEAARILGLPRTTLRRYLEMVEDQVIEKAIEEKKVEPAKAMELRSVLGKETARGLIAKRSKEELESLTWQKIQSMRRAPMDERLALAKAEIDIEDVEPPRDTQSEEEEDVEDVMEDPGVLAAVGAQGGENEGEEGEPGQVVGTEPTEVRHPPFGGTNEGGLPWVDACEEITHILPTAVLSIEDEDVKKEGVRALHEAYTHLSFLVEALNRDEPTLAMVPSMIDPKTPESRLLPYCLLDFNSFLELQDRYRGSHPSGGQALRILVRSARMGPRGP